MLRVSFNVGDSRGIYAKPPHASGNKETAIWKLTKPPYGLCAACKDWYITIRDTPSIDCGGVVITSGRSGFFATTKSRLEFRKRFGRKSKSSNEPSILKVDTNFASRGRRNAAGVTPILVFDLLMSRCCKSPPHTLRIQRKQSCASGLLR